VKREKNKVSEGWNGTKATSITFVL